MTFLNLLESIKIWEPRVRVVVYTLDTMPSDFYNLVTVWDNVAVKAFDFSKYPTWFNITQERGQYAWKGVIIERTAKEYGGLILWMDSGNLVHRSLHDNVWRYIAQKGIYSTPTSGNQEKWTHPLALNFLGIGSHLSKKHMCNGAIIGVNTLDRRVMDDIIQPLAFCCQSKDCIAPPGSSRANHRQDQSALTALIYKHGYSCEWMNAYDDLASYSVEERLTISIHNDVLGEGSKMCEINGESRDC